MSSKEADLVAWLLENGGFVHPDLSLFSELDNGDRGVRAKKAIAEGDQLLIVPKALCIYVRDHAGAKEQAQPDLACLDLVKGMKLSPFLSTVLLVMAGRAQGADCKHAPYLNSLPERHDCLMSWSEEERAMLKGTDLEDRKESAASVFQREVQPLLARHPGVWPPERCGADAFEWACGMVQSRAFHLATENWVTMAKTEGTDLYLIPGIDMINHATQPSKRSTALQLVEQPLTVKCGEPLREVTLQGYFTMKADRDIAAGEEVLHTYGDLSDAQLLQTYGFVEEWAPGEANPHNVAFIPADLVVEGCTAIGKAAGVYGSGDSDAEAGKGRGRKRKGRGEEGEDGGVAAAVARRRQLAERLGLLPPNVVVVPAEAPLTDELLSVAQVLLMPPEDFEEYAEEFKEGEEKDAAGPSKDAGVLAAPVEVRGVLGRHYLDDPDFREAVVFGLLKAVQACMRRYGSSVEEDEALLAQHAQQQQGGGGGSAGGGSDGEQALSWRGICAVRVRLGEKRVLLRLREALLALLAEGDESGDESGDNESEGDDSDGSSEGLGSEDGESGSDEDGASGSEGEEPGSRRSNKKSTGE